MSWKILIRAIFIGATCALSMMIICARESAAATDDSATRQSATLRDGCHDFDFLFGRWKVHLKRKVPGTDRWTESDGYGIYRKVWGGRANLN
jgi:hypothetical protein